MKTVGYGLFGLSVLVVAALVLYQVGNWAAERLRSLATKERQRVSRQVQRLVRRTITTE